MTTLMDRLKQWCKTNNKPLPYGKHLGDIGLVVAEKVKAAGKYDLVQKVDYTMEVNSYPEELLQYVDLVIDQYFNDRKSFYISSRVTEITGKGFTYDVEDYKAPAFESALRLCSIPVELIKSAGIENGMVTYKIPHTSPSQLIKLGKRFQKERWLQQNKSYAEKRAAASVPMKRKRTPVK